MKRHEQTDGFNPDELNETPQPSAEGVGGSSSGGAEQDGAHAPDGDTPSVGKNKHRGKRGASQGQQGSEAEDATPDGDSLNGPDGSFEGAVHKGSAGVSGGGSGRVGNGQKSSGRGADTGDADMGGEPASSSQGAVSKGKWHPLQDLKNALSGGAKGAADGAKGILAGGGRNLMQGAIDGAMNFGAKVTGFVSKGVGGVSNALGVSKTTAGILTAAVALTSVTGGAAVLSTWSAEQNMLAHEYVIEDDCAEDVAKAQNLSTFEGDENAMVEANAAKAWAIFKAIGLTDEQAAGAVGNMAGEGGLSPYAMECDFLTCPNERWGIGPIKQGYLEDLNSWTLNVVFPRYDPNDINEAFYGTSRYGYVAGVGMFGFTGINYDKLEDWATGLGTTWYDEEKAFDVQMSFILAPVANGGYGRSEWLTNWKNDTSGCDTPEGAAVVFCEKFEGISKVADGKLTAARKYYDKFGGTMGDEDYANSVLEMAAVSRAEAAGRGAKNEAEDCGIEAGVYDNSSLAEAAVAYAYETEDMGRGNDGTELYRVLHERIFPGDPYFQSCDRGVATAIRWAGADDLFPAGATGSQLAHCQDNPNKWEYIGSFASLNIAEEMEPGDVIVCDGHITMYVGNEAVQKKFPGSTADMVSASLNERSPGCGSASGLQSYDSRPYEVFRLKFYDENSRYKDIVEGESLNDR